MRRLNSLGARLLLAIGLVVVLSVGLTLALGTELTRREVKRATLRDLNRKADLIATLAGFVNPVASLKEQDKLVRRQRERIELVPLSRPSPYLPEGQSRVRAGRPVSGTVEVGGVTYYYAARKLPGLDEPGFVLLQPSRLSAVNARPYVQRLLLAGLVGALFAVLVSFLLARAITRPVRRVAEASRNLGADRSHEPVPEQGPTELASLAASFNDMARQLERARLAERSFLLSVSHELKTPLTAIRGYAEGLQEDALPADEAAETIRREADRLERLVRDLLDLARMNRSEFNVKREPIDLAAIARDTVRRYEQQARSFGVHLEVEALGPAHATGDSDRTLQAVSNLVENALRLTPAGGSVRVVAEGSGIAVDDTGPGLKPEELDRAFERFFLHSRYGGERPVGTGLGLAIVKQLAEGMGGTVEVRSTPGRSTRFLVRLPGGPSAPGSDSQSSSSSQRVWAARSRSGAPPAARPAFWCGCQRRPRAARPTSRRSSVKPLALYTGLYLALTQRARTLDEAERRLPAIATEEVSHEGQADGLAACCGARACARQHRGGEGDHGHAGR